MVNYTPKNEIDKIPPPPLFDKNTIPVLLLVVEMAAPSLNVFKMVSKDKRTDITYRVFTI